MNILDNILLALPLVFSYQVILAMALGTCIGIAVGALPGLSATMGIAVLIPLTFAMEPLVALGMIAGIYNGSMYGGAIPAILLRIPGTPSGIATVFDGYPMTQNGRAKLALKIALVSSAIGSAISAIVALLLAPPLASIALMFSPANYFLLAFFGILTISIVLDGSPVKGIMSAALGLIIGLIGIDPINGSQRFTFGSTELLSGVNIIVLLTGLYAIPPAINMVVSSLNIGEKDLSTSLKNEKFAWTSLFPVWSRASVIGVICGIIPALGGNIAALLAWSEQRRVSKNKDNFGSGEPEGIAAAECANNADVAATLIPTLTLGVPGNSVAAVIMGALLVHGLQPGPALFTASAGITYGFLLALLITAGMLFVIGQLGAHVFVNILRVPRLVLGPSILVITVIGIYTIHNSIFEVWLMFAFGLLGYCMEHLKIPPTPAVLAVILGPIAESALRRALLISGGDWSILFEGTIAKILLFLIFFAVAMPIFRKFWNNKTASS